MHTARVILLSILAVGAAAACYQPPRIPRDKPLPCSSSDAGECPSGFVCIANQICAPDSCKGEEDCPDGLACTRMGCLPRAADGGGADGGEDSPANAGGGPADAVGGLPADTGSGLPPDTGSGLPADAGGGS